LTESTRPPSFARRDDRFIGAMTKSDAEKWIEEVRGELRTYQGETTTGAVPEAFTNPAVLYASLTVGGDSVAAAFLPPVPSEERLTVFLVEHFIESYGENLRRQTKAAAE
jgi:hypothetical protein